MSKLTSILTGFLLLACASINLPSDAAPYPQTEQEKVIAKVQTYFPTVDFSRVETFVLTDAETDDVCGQPACGCSFSGSDDIVLTTNRGWSCGPPACIIAHELGHIASKQLYGNLDSGHTLMAPWYTRTIQEFCRDL